MRLHQAGASQVGTGAGVVFLLSRLCSFCSLVAVHFAARQIVGARVAQVASEDEKVLQLHDLFGVRIKWPIKWPTQLRPRLGSLTSRRDDQQS